MARDLAHLSDEALVALPRARRQAALAELYDRFGRVAYGLALRVVRDPALAEDAVQEAFLAVWRSAARFVPERAKASTWILTLVHRRAVDIVRREEPRRAEPLEAAPTAERRPDRGRSVAALRARARAGGAADGFPTSSGRRSSSPTTAASRSPSSRRGSASRSVPSRAGCSPASRRLRELLAERGREEERWNAPEFTS